jgi:hypothetical protein
MQGVIAADEQARMTPPARAQKIAMRREGVMVISCPTPAIGVFPEDFNAPGSSHLRRKTRRMPGEVTER